MLKPVAFVGLLNIISCALIPGMAFAEDAVVAATPAASALTNNIANNPLNANYLAQLVVGLLVVILCIIALAWFAKRFGRLQTSSDGTLQMLGGMSMGARERIVLVQVGDKQLLLGVAPGQINTLHVLDEPVQPPAARNLNTGSGSFAEKLGAILSQGKAS